MSAAGTGVAAVIAVASFLVGAVNPASLLARAFGTDLRASGSGNPGATNAGRVLGVRWGVVVGLLDVLKAYLPVLLLVGWLGLSAALLGGLFVVLGHMFSPFLRGHGGKGVAAAFGAILAVAPVVGLVSAVVFGGFVVVVRTIGRASVLTCIVLLVVGVAGGVGAPGTAFLEPLTGWWLALLAAVVIARHHRNIRAWLAVRVG